MLLHNEGPRVDATVVVGIGKVRWLHHNMMQPSQYGSYRQGHPLLPPQAGPREQLPPQWRQDGRQLMLTGGRAATHMRATQQL